MDRWEIVIDGKIEKAIKKLKKKDPPYLKKLQVVIAAIRNDPRKGKYNPETLKYQRDGKERLSRRLNKKDRIVYVISDNKIIIESIFGHYKDT